MPTTHEPSALPDAEYLPRRTVAERVVRGQQMRDRVPLELHAEWAPTPSRPDPIETLEEQGTHRIEELLPIRYGRMGLSAFAYYRGAAAIMANDLATSPTCGLRAQLCGDAHLLNFGLFETPERSLVFGLNDFDETLPGPIEWDVKRLAASVEIAGRDLAFTRGQRSKAVLATVRAYRDAMRGFAEMRNLDVWYSKLPAEELLARLAQEADPASEREVEKRINKAMHKDHLLALDRLVDHQGDGLQFRHDPPILVPVEHLLDGVERQRYVEVIHNFLQQYRSCLAPDRRALVESYRFVHIARKVVGVGSVGTRAWVVLLVGRDEGDPLVLQMKEAQTSVLEPYAGKTPYDSQGQRVVYGQRLMQAAADHLLGWYALQGFDGKMHDFYVRQLWDGKASVEVAHLTPKGLLAYGEACGWTLARGHARSGDRIAMAAYLGDDTTFEEVIAAWSSAYADTSQLDHLQLVEALDDGRLPFVSGV